MPVDELVETFDVFLEVAVLAAHEDLAGVVVIGPGLGSFLGVAHGDAELLNQGIGRTHLVDDPGADDLQDQVGHGIEIHV